MKLVWLLPVGVMMFLALVTGCEKEPPPRAEIVFTGAPGTTVHLRDRVFHLSKGNLGLLLPGGSYFFRFTAPGKVGEWQNIQLKAGEKRNVALKLQPQRSGVLIESKPAGADVVMDGKSVGTTPLVIDNLPVGKYSAELRLKGYAVRKVEWTLEDERPRSVKVDLNSNIGKLEVTSKPAKAQVLLDGNVVGATPYSTELEEGKYTLRLEHPGFTPQEQPVVVTSGETASVDLQLTALPGGIQVNTNPEGAVVILNDQRRGLTPCRISDLKPGIYELRVEKAGYDPEEKTLEVTSGFQDELHFDLLSSTGSVEFDVRPAGVTVMLDGEVIALTEEEGDSGATKLIRKAGISPGTHKLTISHRFAYPQSRIVEFEVTKGKTTRLKPLELWIANCELKYKDGRVERGALFFENDEFVQFGPEPGIKIQIEKSRLESVRKLTFE